jgi:hypothetical protein
VLRRNQSNVGGLRFWADSHREKEELALKHRVNIAIMHAVVAAGRRDL